MRAHITILVVVCSAHLGAPQSTDMCSHPFRQIDAEKLACDNGGRTEGVRTLELSPAADGTFGGQVGLIIPPGLANCSVTLKSSGDTQLNLCLLEPDVNGEERCLIAETGQPEVCDTSRLLSLKCGCESGDDCADKAVYGAQSDSFWASKRLTCSTEGGDIRQANKEQSSNCQSNDVNECPDVTSHDEHCTTTQLVDCGSDLCANVVVDYPEDGLPWKRPSTTQNCFSKGHYLSQSRHTVDDPYYQYSFQHNKSFFELESQLNNQYGSDRENMRIAKQNALAWDRCGLDAQDPFNTDVSCCWSRHVMDETIKIHGASDNTYVVKGFYPGGAAHSVEADLEWTCDQIDHPCDTTTSSQGECTLCSPEESWPANNEYPASCPCPVGEECPPADYISDVIRARGTPHSKTEFAVTQAQATEALARGLPAECFSVTSWGEYFIARYQEQNARGMSAALMQCFQQVHPLHKMTCMKIVRACAGQPPLPLQVGCEETELGGSSNTHVCAEDCKLYFQGFEYDNCPDCANKDLAHCPQAEDIHDATCDVLPTASLNFLHELTETQNGNLREFWLSHQREPRNNLIPCAETTTTTTTTTTTAAQGDQSGENEAELTGDPHLTSLQGTHRDLGEFGDHLLLRMQQKSHSGLAAAASRQGLRGSNAIESNMS